MGHTAASRKSLNNAPWKTLSQKTNFCNSETDHDIKETQSAYQNTTPDSSRFLWDNVLCPEVKRKAAQPFRANEYNTLRKDHQKTDHNHQYRQSETGNKLLTLGLDSVQRLTLLVDFIH